MTRSTNSSAESALRTVLRINAATSGLGGLFAAVAPRSLDEILGTGHVGWVRLVGVGLMAFAALVVVVSRRNRDQLVRVVPAISLGDGSWVVGTTIAVALGWFSTSGAIVMGLVALMVGVFGIEQALLVRALSTRGALAVAN